MRGRGVLETLARALSFVPEQPTVDAALAILVRAKRSTVDDVARLCEAIRALTAGVRGALVLVHTHVDLVKKLGLDGAHLASGVAATFADTVDHAARMRAAMPTGTLLGCSRHAGDALDDVALASFDYVTLSPVFAPTSKHNDTRPTLGLDGLRAHVGRCARPVVALGGVHEHNARACLDHGAVAVAVLGAAMSARDPRTVTTSLLARTASAPSGSRREQVRTP